MAQMGYMGRSMLKPFSYSPPLKGEEKLVFQLEVARQIASLLILIVVLFVALRECKRNGGRSGQTTTVCVNASGSGSGSGDAYGQTSGDHIDMSPTSLAVKATMPF